MAARSTTLKMARDLAGDEDVVRALRERLPEGFEQLNRIMSGDVRRNDALVLKSLALALQYSQPLPKQQVEHSGAVGCMVVDPYAMPLALGEVIEVPASLPAQPVKALPPIIRKKKSTPPGTPGTGAGTAPDPRSDNFAVPSSCSPEVNE